MQPIYTKNRTIGLLGGSFNPAHAGHLTISDYALKLGIDQVWWLVSPHNPLKDKNSLADYRKRLDFARGLVAHQRRIVVSDLEARQHLHYTYQTIRYLKRRYPGTHFVWLMGADNLAQLHRWRCWQEIMHKIPMLIFDRAPFSHTALRSKAAIFARRFSLKNMDITAPVALPSLAFIHMRRDPRSATHIRKTLGKRAFLRHNENAGSELNLLPKGERP